MCQSCVDLAEKRAPEEKKAVAHRLIVGGWLLGNYGRYRFAA